MLVYLVWETCILTNEETGRSFGHYLFGGKSHFKFHANQNEKKILIFGLNTCIFIHYARCDTLTVTKSDFPHFFAAKKWIGVETCLVLSLLFKEVSI